MDKNLQDSGENSAIVQFVDHAIDAYRPAAIAERIEASGVSKAGLGIVQTLTLAVLAGAFIAFGAMLFTLVMTDSGLGFGPARLLGGVAFSLGLILVVIAGAELFTGNNLIIMAWADRKITTLDVLRNWTLVYAGNLIGAVATALFMSWSGTLTMGDGSVSRTALAIAQTKASLPLDQAFVRGILCNALVCLAVWLSYAAHSVSGKILAIVFPISAFVALGFEHSVANMYFVPLGMLIGDTITIGQFLGNLIAVTAGNLIGGSVLVGLVYWIAYRR
ncbi:MAG: formate/nitrite transporter family protein [Rhodospirillaceae bacterium]|jgi:formate transporter|nr:formate/nitrite transporter family protein [Rhodospirillaceae bacterium]MBT5455914.1 formate/nitrite transporter family protein [Rhodospirillaceae bacterium]